MKKALKKTVIPLRTIKRDKDGHLLYYNLCPQCGIIVSMHLHLCPMCNARIIGETEDGK